MVDFSKEFESLHEIAEHPPEVTPPPKEPVAQYVRAAKLMRAAVAAEEKKEPFAPAIHRAEVQTTFLEKLDEPKKPADKRSVAA